MPRPLAPHPSRYALAGLLLLVSGCSILVPPGLLGTPAANTTGSGGGGGPSAALPGGIPQASNVVDVPKPVVERISAEPADLVPADDGLTVTLRATARSPSGSSLNYTWHADGGTLVNTLGAEVQWHPPTTPGRVQLQVVVLDTRGLSSIGTVTITVKDKKDLPNFVAATPTPAPPAEPTPTPMIDPVTGVAATPTPAPIAPTARENGKMYRLAAEDPRGGGLALTRLKLLRGKVYAVSGNNRIVTIDTATGAVSTVAGSLLPQGSTYYDYAIAADGSVLAMANTGNANKFVRVHGGVIEEGQLGAAGEPVYLYNGLSLGLDGNGQLLAAKINGSQPGIYRFDDQFMGTQALGVGTLGPQFGPTSIVSAGNDIYFLNNATVYRSGGSVDALATITDQVNALAVTVSSIPVVSYSEPSGRAVIGIVSDNGDKRPVIGGETFVQTLADGVPASKAKLEGSISTFVVSGRDILFVYDAEPRGLWLAKGVL